MASNYREAMRILSRNLQGRAESPLGHPTALGDHREALLNAMLHHESIPEIPNFVFAFDGIAMDTAAEPWLQFPGIDVVCVLGKYTIAKENLGFPANPPKLCLWAEGDDAFGAFVFLIEKCLEQHLEALRWVAPNWQRYYLSPEIWRNELNAAARPAT